MIKNKNIIIALVLFIVGFSSRYFLAIGNFSSLDSVQYAIGTFQFSLFDHTPPPPGYFLYIMSGKFLNLFFANPHDAMIFISVIYSGLIAVVLFLLGRELFSNASGLIASILFITSPVFWYKGITIYAYLNSGFFILLIALFCYRVIQGENKFIYFAAAAYALLTGIRPQEFPMFILLFLFALYHTSRRQRINAILIFAFISAAWLLPLIIISGGMQSFLQALKAGSGYLINNSIFGGSIISQLNNHLIRMGQYFQRAYFLGILPLFYYLGRFFYLPNLYDNRKAQFFFLLIFPVLFFNIFIQFAEIGHGMAWGLALFLLIGESIVVLAKDTANLSTRFFKFIAKRQALTEKGIGLCILVPIAAFNTFMFFNDFDFSIFNYKNVVYDDRQFNYADLKKASDYLDARFDYIEKNFNINRAIIIPSNRFWRQVMYRFPESIVLQSDRLHKQGRSLLRYCFGMKCIEQNKDYFEIPSGISTAIIFDDAVMPYAGAISNSKVMRIDDSAQIIAVDLKKHKRIEFEFHSIALD